MKLLYRLTSETPSFFKRVRNIGLMLTAVSAAIMAAPVALPAALVTVAGYLTVAGAVATAVAQAAKNDE
jgi:hypothetical protein